MRDEQNKTTNQKNNPSKSHYSTGWNIFGAVCLIGEMALTLLGGAKNKKK
ncbi:hypothetical protein [Helicobacter pylori]|nr:hypothetical protein [Helicobacter pylori]